MTIADEARNNAINCEMVLYAYRKNKDGVVVSFVVHPNDMPAELATAPIGARFVSALVQVGDDERPIAQAEKEKAKPTAVRSPTPRPAPQAGARRKPWETLLPQQQAAMRTGEPAFIAFLKESYPKEWHETGEADACLKLICRVDSKRDLETNQKARMLWTQLDSHFQAWERAAV